MKRLATLGFLVVIGALCAVGPSPAAAQVRYLRGQNIAPVFEGWRRNADGTIRMYFGYLNRNYEETIDIPVGPANGFEPGDPDRGQPTHFLTRRMRFLFFVTVPKDWDPQRRLIWTLTVNGKTEKAHGWLQPEWEIDDGVIQMNIGGGSAPPDPPNAAPIINGTPDQTAAVGRPLTLTVSATDDGTPKPRKRASGTVPGSAGVTLRWMQYRGPGTVTFSRERSERIFGQPVELTTEATFPVPGTYVLRAMASDGLFESWHELDVVVK